MIDKFRDPTWKRALDAFKRIAKKYKKEHNRLPIVIFDNANRLAHMDKEVLQVLQDDAKDSADSHSYIVVFVSGEGIVPEIMMCKYKYYFCS